MKKIFQAELIFTHFCIGSVTVKFQLDLCIVVNTFYLIIAVYQLVWDVYK